MRILLRLCLASAIALAGACASIPRAPAPDPVAGAAGGAAACAIFLLWLYPPACGGAVLIGGAIGVARTRGHASP